MRTAFLQLITVVAALILASCDASRSGKLDVTILYESLCPDSNEFFENQLLPNYNGLKDYIQLTFVPFGKAAYRRRGVDEFTCQHGPRECYFNMVQSCALHALRDKPDAQMVYTGCMMTEPLYKYSALPTVSEQICADKAQLDFNEINYCTQTKQGIELQLFAERQTNQVSVPTKLPFVPYIVFGDQVNEQLFADALDDFLGTVCRLIHKIAPACR